MKQVQKVVGAGVTSPNRIMLLRDADGDGIAETRSVFLQACTRPSAWPWSATTSTSPMPTRSSASPTSRARPDRRGAGASSPTCPAGPINHHWTKNLVASPDGTKLYVDVGSNSNVAENGIDAEDGRAAILEIDRATGEARIFASGLRNPVGMDWQPQTGALWTVGQRARRARRRSGARLHDLGAARRLLRLALQLLRRPCRHAGRAAAARPGRQGDRSRLRAWRRTPLRWGWPSTTATPSRALSRRRLHRPARLLEPLAASGYKVIFVPFADGRPAGAPEDC